ncbi:MAG TPA: hypothetical protein VNJ11_01720 [Bryobacteraceae bacterium]|nr:hypothetical protein [Bryobacteraceae bacterium]
MPERSQFWELREAYEAAFRELAHRVRTLQSLSGQPEADVRQLEECRMRVAEALETYRERRDRLAALMLESVADGKEQDFARAAVSGGSTL